MARDLTSVLDKVEDAARAIFAADPSVRSVGMGKSIDGHRFVAVRNVQAIVPLAAAIGSPLPLAHFDGIPV